MNANESAPPHLLMQNVRDIRKRLMETEKTLNTLTKAEARLDNDDLDDVISVTSSENYRGGLRFEDREEDRESLQSAGVATLPDSSYAGFERVQPPSSTPNRPQARSRLAGVLETAEQSDEEERRYQDKDAYKGPRHRTGQRDHRIQSEPDMLDDRHDLRDGDQPRDRRLQRELDFEDDRQDLRGQVRFLKEANKKVLIQNQKLMNEVEKTSFELQASRAKVCTLTFF